MLQKQPLSGSQTLPFPVVLLQVDQSSWGPPYQITPAATARSPLFLAEHTCDRKGFEEPTLFYAPDGMLHFIGHDHGSCANGKYAHYISRNKSLTQWQEAAPFGAGVSSGEFEEPNPIPTAGDGVFGNAIREEWVDFGPNVATAGLRFSHVSWRWTNATTGKSQIKTDDDSVELQRASTLTAAGPPTPVGFGCAFGGGVDARRRLSVDLTTGSYSIAIDSAPSLPDSLLQGAPFRIIRGGKWLSSGGQGLALTAHVALSGTATDGNSDGNGDYTGKTAMKGRLSCSKTVPFFS